MPFRVVLLLAILAIATQSCSPNAAPETPRDTAVPVDAPRTSAQSGDTTGDQLDPITGYADFSQQDYFDVHPAEVVEHLRQCLADNGFAVSVIPPGDGLSFAGIPTEQSASAQQILERCRDGLSLPEPRPPTREELRAHFDALLEGKACVESMGYAVEPPPDFDTFVDSYATGPWHPFSSLSAVGDDEWREIQENCAVWRTTG